MIYFIIYWIITGIALCKHVLSRSNASSSVDILLGGAVCFLLGGIFLPIRLAERIME